MSVFRKKTAGGPRNPETVPLPPTIAYCRICDDRATFTKRWRRVHVAGRCACCGLEFSAVPHMIEAFQPQCPRCFEYIEQPTFEYGECDGCGSKFELLDGTYPNLLPNKFQREQMDKVGKVWRR